MRPAPLVALATALAMGAGTYFLRGDAARETRALPESVSAAPVREAPADWCTVGYEPISGGCLAVPAPSGRASLVIYLHGRYAKDQDAEEIGRQRRVAARFTSKGFAVLALRGRLGGCGTPELSSWYCWPSNERTMASAGDVVGAWQAALAEADGRLHPEHRFVLGFSNGGYFAVLLASRGLVQADAYAIAHAGPVEPMEATRGTPPLLLLSADDDIAQDDMLRLDGELKKRHWPHDSFARDGTHGLTDQDIDAALVFFARSTEPEPLAPLAGGWHRPSHHPHDAEAPPSIASIEGTPEPPPASRDADAETATEEDTPY